MAPLESDFSYDSDFIKLTSSEELSQTSQFFFPTELLLNFGVIPERIVEESCFSFFTTRYSLVVKGLREA